MHDGIFQTGSDAFENVATCVSLVLLVRTHGTLARNSSYVEEPQVVLNASNTSYPSIHPVEGLCSQKSFITTSSSLGFLWVVIPNSIAGLGQLDIRPSWTPSLWFVLWVRSLVTSPN